jgi:hypothetical protein
MVKYSTQEMYYILDLKSGFNILWHTNLQQYIMHHIKRPIYIFVINLPLMPNNFNFIFFLNILFPNFQICTILCLSEILLQGLQRLL